MLQEPRSPGLRHKQGKPHSETWQQPLQGHAPPLREQQPSLAHSGTVPSLLRTALGQPGQQEEFGWLWEEFPDPERRAFPEEELTAPQVTGTRNSIQGGWEQSQPTDQQRQSQEELGGLQFRDQGSLAYKK